jgi:hypothetical protein
VHHAPINSDAAIAVNPLLTRITADPRIFGGKPIVRGIRVRLLRRTA